MTEPMSEEQLAEIRAAADRDRWSTYCGHAGPRAMVTDLLAEVDRLRAQLAEIGETKAEWAADGPAGWMQDPTGFDPEQYARNIVEQAAEKGVAVKLMRRLAGEWREASE